jgi:hypothetical protein
MQINEQEQKEIALVVSDIKSKSDFKISSNEEMAKASNLLPEIKLALENLLERKTKIIKPLLDATASVRDLFSPFETELKNAEKKIKTEMLAFSNFLMEKQRIEAEKIAAKVESGKMKPEQAASKLAKIEQPLQKNENFTKQKRRAIEVYDESLIPREYMEPNLGKISEDVLKNGKNVAGVKVIINETIVIK